MEDLVKTLKEDAKRCVIDYISTDEAFHNSYVTYDINTVLLDLVQCLENSKQKREKRLARINFLIKICNNSNLMCNIKESTNDRIDKIKKIINKEINKTYKLLNYIPSIFNRIIIKDDPKDSSLYILEEENKLDLENSESFSFKKHNINDYFFSPEKQKFHDHCKKILNKDGKVYDIFTYVAIIIFYNLTTDIDNPIYNELDKKILASCYLIFKGGASIGKHIIQNDYMIWNTLNDDDKSYVYNEFIYGGDNDTSINIDINKFNEYNTIQLHEYNINDINNSIKLIMSRIPIYMEDVLKKYKIESIIQNYITDVIKTNFDYINIDFRFKNRQSLSYSIIDDPKDSSLLLKENHGTEKTQLYCTNSYVEFLDSKKNINKFYLARIKCGYSSEKILFYDNYNDKLTINCYAECLDISFPCIDSNILINDTNYININHKNILFR